MQNKIAGKLESSPLLCLRHESKSLFRGNIKGAQSMLRLSSSSDYCFSLGRSPKQEDGGFLTPGQVGAPSKVAPGIIV